MTFYRAIALLLHVVACPILFSQDNVYEPLKSKGEIPIELRTPTAVKIARQNKNMPSNMSYQDIKVYKEFSEKSNYSIDQLLLSGKVLFNDPLSDYVTKVGRQVLKGEDSEFADSIKFFVLRSDLTNAFATNQGLVFVTLGLISQLQNEAELAFVLAHEIGHIKLKHVVGNYLKEQRLMRDRRKQYYAHNDLILKLSQYSKQAEIEADSMGYLYLSKTEYSTEAMMSVFSVLQYSYLPFDEFKYDISYLETEDYKISNDVKLDTIIPISFDENYDDSKSTHPNISKRIKRIENYAIAEGIELKKKRDFIHDEDTFIKLRNTARFESIRLNLRDRNYHKALYNIQYLLKDNPDDEFLIVSKCKALYGLTKYKTQSKLRSISPRWSDTEGQISTLYRTIHEMDEEELHVLVLNYLYQTNLKLKNKHIGKLVYDLMWDTGEEYEKSLTDIQAEIKRIEIQDSILLNDSKVAVEESDTIKEVVNYDNLTKYEKIKLMKEKTKIEVNKEEGTSEQFPFHLNALKSSMNDTAFVKLFTKAHDRYLAWDKNNKKREEAYNKLSYRQRNFYRKKQDVHELNKEINDVLIVDPFYYLISDRKGFKITASDDAQIKFNKNIDHIAKKSGLDVKMVSSKNLLKSDVDEFNDMTQVYDWLGEKLSHENVYFIPSEQEYMQEIKDKYNTSNIMFTGVMGYKEIREYRGGVLLYTALIYPLFPFGLYYALTPQNHTYFYTLVLDINNGNIKINDISEVKRKATTGTVNSILYDRFLEIQKEEVEDILDK